MLPVLADGTNRTTASDVRLGPHLIPKGTMVWVPLKGLFNSPHNWADPEQYNPVRAYPVGMPLELPTLWQKCTEMMYVNCQAQACALHTGALGRCQCRMCTAGGCVEACEWLKACP